MPRPPLRPGQRGDISVAKTDTAWQARLRYRDNDHRIRYLAATGKTKGAARTALNDKWAETNENLINAHHDTAPTLGELLHTWLTTQERHAEKPGKRSRATIVRYEHLIRRLTDRFPQHAARDADTITPGALTDMFDTMINRAGQGHSNARNTRSLLTLAYRWGVAHDLVTTNPARDTEAIPKPPRDPDSLTTEELTRIRQALHHTTSRPGPRSHYLNDVIELLLGTGARIGEIMALGWHQTHLDTDDHTPWITIDRTLTTIDRAGTQDFAPTKGRDARMIALPDFAADILTRRRRHTAAHPTLVFASRRNTIIPPNNVRRSLRTTLRRAGIDERLITRATPHAIRRTVATMIEREYGLEEAAKQLGHPDETITRQFYVTPQRTIVDHTTLLNRLAAPPEPPT